jgi:hypothetical protein
MAPITPGIPRHTAQWGNRRHGSGNEYGVPGIPAAKFAIRRGRRKPAPHTIPGGIRYVSGGERVKRRKKLRPLIYREQVQSC